MAPAKRRIRTDCEAVSGLKFNNVSQNGSVGDSYDNVPAETVIGLRKTAVINPRSPLCSFETVEYATLEWADWLNHRRLLAPIGTMPPAEAEARCFAQIKEQALAV